MKKVKLTNNCITPDIEAGTYRVWLGDYNELGNVNYHYFTSQKKSEKFIQKTNKFLTDTLHELNMLYSRVGFEYRINWAVFNYTSEAFKLERKISECLRSVEDNFNSIFSLCRVNNRDLGTHVFRKLNNNCDFLCEVIDVLIGLNKKSSTTNNVYNYKFILNEIVRVKDRLNDYSDSSKLYSTSLPEKPKTKLFPQAIKHNNNVKRKNSITGVTLQFRDRLKPKNNNNSSQRKTNNFPSDADIINY